ncbi:aminopeptidase P N-terminal domain-containing protein [Brumimicrobium sp.]|uniref:aminopeptidase P N-terminal domain-containing protein n=1 Tax=Brumimicrobium sp. TaxID=2029867 RepID=UPI0026182AF7|nr:aminopeptidase P N-terminal domain-containing protein [uncultured Brumimicrobium sp.]
MKYERIDKRLFERNRAKFTKRMKENTVAVFNSNDIYPISADSTMPFEQHRDIFYLSGVDQEESILVLFPNASDEKHREVLFLKETNDHIAVWEGEKLTKEAAFETAGIKTVYWLDQFDTIFNSMMAEAEGIYFNTNEHLRANTETQTREDRFIIECKKRYPAHQVHKSAPILHEIRSVKEDIELDLMQTACDITEKAYKRVLKFIKPGVWEHEIEAEIIHEFIRNRSNGFAYTPIIASGKNACVLHYIENNQECKDGEVILMDFGAKYANYAADQTRSVPVNGKYTPRQKEVYNAVLHVKKEAEKLLVPGTLIPEYHKEVGLLMQEQLLKLKLIDKTDIKNQDPNWPAYKKYFMHGTSHFIGLDTHDSGLYHKPIQAGMVFTCEPGIYIPEEGLGIRLEDDLIVQEKGAPINMMPGLPLEADEVEDYMNS